MSDAPPGWYYYKGDQKWWDGSAWSDTPPPGADSLRLTDREFAKQRKRAENQELEHARAAKEAAASFAASPPGQARAAFERGDAFFQLEIEVNRLSGGASSFGSSSNYLQRRGRPDLLGQIEDEGFRLEHTGYVFIETGATSTNRVLTTGQGTVTRGFVQGIYLFRRVEKVAM